MGYNTQKLLFYLIVMLLTVYPIFEMFRKRLKWYVRGALIVAIFCFFALALSVKNIEDTEKRTADMKADSLRTELTKSNGLLINKTDSVNRFLEDLKKIYGIRDSVGHAIPIKNYKPTFNTHINKANRVTIG